MESKEISSESPNPINTHNYQKEKEKKLKNMANLILLVVGEFNWKIKVLKLP